MNNSILVLGSRGNVGRILVSLLAESGHTVLAAQREPSDGGAQPGVTPVAFDLTAPATFERALDGADRVFVMSPPGHFAADELLTPFLRRAFEQRRKFVVMTASGVEFNEAAPLRKVERAVESSSHPFVFLRPNWFMDNFHTFWLPMIQHTRKVTLPAADSRTSFVSARDIAHAAAAALTRQEFDGQAFALTGPEAFTYAEAVEVLSRSAGREVAYEHIDDEAFVAMMRSAGLPEDYSRLLAQLFSFVRQGAAEPVSDGVTHLAGRVPETLREYAERNAAAWR